MLSVISGNGDPSVLVTLPTIFPVPADAFRCPSSSINLFVKCKSAGFWFVGEDAHDAQEQNMTAAIRVPIKNRGFFIGIINLPFKVYEDLNNLEIVKVELVFQIIHPIGIPHSFNGIIRRGVRFYVNEWSSIQHIQPFDSEYIPISFNYFNGSHTNRIRPPRTTTGEYTHFRHVFSSLRFHFKLDLIYLIKPVKNDKIRIFI